jgi:hypothetical protein
MLFLIVFFALAYLGVLLLTWQEPSSLLLLLLSLILLLGAVFRLPGPEACGRHRGLPLAMVFRRNPTPPEGNWKPTPEEWRVYTLCDGRRTEEEVVRESGLGESAYLILANLLKRGLILPVEGPKELCGKLVDLLKTHLGPRAEPFVKRLQACESRETLEEEALRVALKVKLTLDKRAGEELEKAIRALFR